MDERISIRYPVVVVTPNYWLGRTIGELARHWAAMKPPFSLSFCPRCRLKSHRYSVDTLTAPSASIPVPGFQAPSCFMMDGPSSASHPASLLFGQQFCESPWAPTVMTAEDTRLTSVLARAIGDGSSDRSVSATNIKTCPSRYRQDKSQTNQFSL